MSVVLCFYFSLFPESFFFLSEDNKYIKKGYGPNNLKAKIPPNFPKLLIV